MVLTLDNRLPSNDSSLEYSSRDRNWKLLALETF